MQPIRYVPGPIPGRLVEWDNTIKAFVHVIDESRKAAESVFLDIAPRFVPKDFIEDQAVRGDAVPGADFTADCDEKTRVPQDFPKIDVNEGGDFADKRNYFADVPNYFAQERDDSADTEGLATEGLARSSLAHVNAASASRYSMQANGCGCEDVASPRIDFRLIPDDEVPFLDFSQFDTSPTLHALRLFHRVGNNGKFCSLQYTAHSKY